MKEIYRAIIEKNRNRSIVIVLKDVVDSGGLYSSNSSAYTTGNQKWSVPSSTNHDKTTSIKHINDDNFIVLEVVDHIIKDRSYPYEKRSTVTEEIYIPWEQIAYIKAVDIVGSL